MAVGKTNEQCRMLVANTQCRLLWSLLSFGDGLGRTRKSLIQHRAKASNSTTAATDFQSSQGRPSSGQSQQHGKV